MKKLKVVFDVHLITDCLNPQNQGTGIFYVAYNVFKSLLKDERIELILYDDRLTKERIDCFKKHFPCNNFKTLHSPKLSQALSLLKKYKSCNYKKYGSNILAKGTRGVIKIILLPIIKILQAIYKRIRINLMSIYFSPVYKIPNWIERKQQKNKYVILYDTVPLVLPDKNPTSNPDSWFMQLIRQINKKDNYFAISDFTKREFIKHVPLINDKRITVALLAASDKFYPSADKDINKTIREKYNIPLDKKYFLSLCTIEPRKNLTFSVKNFIEFIEQNSISDLVFVLAGGYWKNYSESILHQIEEMDKYKNRIILTGYVDENDLAPLYSNAECFVYPSIYEGFGLPPLEAMQCGTPVITSNVTSLPEVVGDVGIMINPYCDSELLDAYKRIYYDDNLRKELSEKGIERAKQFSWKKCTDIMVNQFYKDLNVK